ncbi:hypothetical protein [Nocardia tengchongensis]
MVDDGVQNAGQGKSRTAVTLRKGPEVSDTIDTKTGHRLLDEVLARYDSLDAFCIRLHAALDAPTDVLPALPASATGRHRLR